MRVLISGGGSGGHVYPALAVAERLRETLRAGQAAAVPTSQVPADAPLCGVAAANSLGLVGLTQPPEPHPLLWVGTPGGREGELVARAGVAYQSIASGQLRGTRPLTAVTNSARMIRGMGQARRIIADFRPHVCLVTGGYVCTPVVVACRSRRVPVLIYLPDMVPGLAIRWLSHLAQRVAVSFPAPSRFFPGKAVVTGYPVRRELLEASADRQAARRHLAQLLGVDLGLQNGLQERRQPPLLLVWGGSQGARSINVAVQAHLAHLLAHAYVLHVTGPLEYDRVRAGEAGWEQTWAERYIPVPYLHEEMSWALAAADLAICRSGASVLGELPMARLPAILVPYPHSGAHQQANAAPLVQQGAACLVSDHRLDSDLLPALLPLLTQPQRRQEMEKALGLLARPHAAQEIVDELANLARRRG